MRVVPLWFLVACNGGGDSAPEGELGSCNPIDPALCALPYPSSFYLREADTPTGFQVHFAEDSLPMNRDGVRLKPDAYNEKDGFGITGPFMTFFDDLSVAGVVGHANVADYAAADAKVVLVDTTTGDRVPAWAELDHTAEEPGERLMYIWPASPLEFGRRYVVGLRGLVRNAGGDVAVSDAFLSLRDGPAGGDPDVELQRAHYDEVVFPALEGAGVPRGELQLAWDFVTVSRQSSLGRMEFIRDDGLSRMGDDGPDYEVYDVEDHDCATGPIFRDIRLTLTVPLYTEVDGVNTRLTRDENGMPYYNGDTHPMVLVRIPCTAVTDPRPLPILHYGHGLLGLYDEAYTGWLSDFANDYGWVVVAHTWTGMSTPDGAAISLALAMDASDFAIVPERSHQGYLEAMAALRLMTGPFAEDALVTFPDAGGREVSVVDTGTRAYYGNSQGGIMGGAYLAMSPDIERGVLGVPGMPYSLLLDRSHDFDPFFALFKAKYTDHREISFVIESYEHLWEPAESAGWAHEMGGNAAAGIPPKQVLLHAGIGDAQVTTLGAQVMARAFGADTIAPETRPVFGVAERASGQPGSALVEWRYLDVPDEPIENLPASGDFDTHECPRREPAGQRQIDEFLRTGVVTNHCDGACDDTLRSELCGG